MTNRYDRQIRFDAFGEQGQDALRRASILVLGAGALGSAASEMLVRAGVGELRIVDRDVIELSNLHRQQLYDEEDVARQLPKAIAAKSRLQAINSDVSIQADMLDVTRHNINSLLDGVTAVIDATDNIETSFNERCDVETKHPLFYGSRCRKLRDYFSYRDSSR